MVCMLFLQSPQKPNQRTFTGICRMYSVLKTQTGRKKIQIRKEVLKKQLIEDSDDDDAVISNIGGNNSTDNLSEPDDEMETGSINDNFRNAFYFAAKINLHTFLVEQVASVLSMSQLLFRVSPSIHKKSKLQTTNYCCQKLPFRCF